MVATDIRCNSGEIVGESLSNLPLIFNNAILMFVFKEYWISIFCFVVQKRSKCIKKVMWFGLDFFRLFAPVWSKSFPSSRVAIFRYFFLSSKFSGVRSFANWMAHFLLFLTAAFHSLDMKHTSLSQSRPPCLHNLSRQLFKVDWFSVRTLVNFTHVNKIQAIYERPRVTVLSEVQLLRLCLAFHIAYTWQWKSTFSLKILNVDHSIVNGNVRRDMQC